MSKGVCSVIIPTFNRVEKCLRAIESCLKMCSYGYEIEVVVVDDGSTDNTKVKVEAIMDSRVRYYCQKNAGASAARNLGVQMSKGDFLFFLDSDDCFFKTRLKVVSEYHEFICNGGIVFCKIGISHSGSSHSYDQVKPFFGYSGGDLSEYLFYKDGFISTPSIVLSKKSSDCVCWDESLSYGDDSDYMLALYSLERKFKMVDEVLVWVDDSDVVDRLSLKSDPDAVLTWFNNNRGKMSRLAEVSYKSKHLSYHLFSINPFLSIYYLLCGLFFRVYGVTGFLKYFLRALFSARLYKRLVKFVLSVKRIQD